MWTRKELKARAKDVLKVSYWKAFLVSLILAFVGGNSGGFSGFRWNFGNNGYNGFYNFDGYDNSASYFDSRIFLFIIGLILMAGFTAIVFGIAFRVFLSYPLEVGARRYFARGAQNEVNLNYLGFSFGKGKYFEIIKAMLWRWLFTCLWTLLFIIPGIIKSYSYSMVPYILTDNPKIGYKRALKLSMNMTKGHKFKMFILDLSFLGWIILGIILCGIGVLFVLPYVNATKAELYLVLRQKALDNGLSSSEELTLTPAS